MKKLMIICVAAGLILAGINKVEAAYVTYEFRANDLIDLFGMDFTTGLKATQDNARRVHEVWTQTWYQTFSNSLCLGTTQPGSGNTYLNWHDGLRADEGLASFSTWLHGDPGARSWGEILLADPAKPMYATAASGWNVEIVETEWDTGYGKGWVAIWWTTNPDKYIRPGGEFLDTFSFTADLYVDTNADNSIAGEPDAQAGEPYRFWFGDTWMNYGDDSLPALVFDNLGWQSRSPNYGIFAQTPGGDAGFEAILTLSGVPEPTTICLLGLGGLALLRKKR